MARVVVRLATAIAAVVMAASLSGACLDPTQITLEVTTDVACAQAKGTAFTGGRPGSVENAPPNMVTGDCNAGRIGTLVATPAGDKESSAAFLVVVGVDRPASECAANGFKGCIVQRRILRYIAHKPLRLPIPMRLDCLNTPCDQFTTCAKANTCVSATIPDPEDCADGECSPPAIDDDAGRRLEDGGADGLVDGPADGPRSDGPLTDGLVDGTTTLPPGKGYCPNNPSGCTTGPAPTCCWSRSGLLGKCKETPSCTDDDLPMRCSGRADCDPGSYCCGASRGSAPPHLQLGVTQCIGDGQPCFKAVCRFPTDCPIAGMICNKTTPYFVPNDHFGICEPP